MNTFFGCDVPNFHKAKKSNHYKHGVKDEPLSRKIFNLSEFNDICESEASMMQDENEKINLRDIIK